MRKVPISGGPHSGKTTLFEALETDFPDAYFVPEPALRVISRELLRQEEDSGYVPVVPWLDYTLFGPVVADESVVLESQIPEESDLVFQDRSLIDTIAYSRLNGFEQFVPELKRRIEVANYAFALFCEPVGEYAVTDVRRETPEEARRTHDYLAQAYDDSGISVLRLPAVSVEERLSIIRNYISWL